MKRPTTHLRRRRTLEELLRDALELTTGNWRVLLVVAAVIVIPVEGVVLGLGLGWFGAGYTPLSTGEAYLELVLQFFVISPLITGVTAMVLRAEEAGETPTARESIQRGFELFVPLLAAAILFLASILVGFLLLLVGAIVFAIRFTAVIPAVAMDGFRPVDGMRRSWELTRGSFWRLVGWLLAINLVPAIIGGVLSALFEAVAKSADAQALQVVGSMAGEILTGPFVVIATVLLYFDLVDRASEPAWAPPAPPLP